MFLEQSFGCIGLCTARECTLVWSLTSMYPQMSLEYTLLIEIFVTSRNGTFENSLVSLMVIKTINIYMGPNMSVESVQLAIALVATIK